MFNNYLVKDGENIKTLASKFNISAQDLMRLNNLYFDSELRAGMEIIVPKNEDKYFNTYIIESGDSLYKIAEKYNINPTLLASLNGLEMEDYIYPGQEILIPKNNYSYYITAEGDTLNEVVKGLNADINKLLEQNNNIYLQKEQLIIYNYK